MELLNQIRDILLMVVMACLAVAICFCLLRAILGPRVTDRIISINLIGTKIIILICVLAYYIGEQYLIDVALVYALISFLAVVVLMNVYLASYNRKKSGKGEEKA